MFSFGVCLLARLCTNYSTDLTEVGGTVANESRKKPLDFGGNNPNHVHIRVRVKVWLGLRLCRAETYRATLGMLFIWRLFNSNTTCGLQCGRQYMPPPHPVMLILVLASLVLVLVLVGLVLVLVGPVLDKSCSLI